jgi:translation initiation factor eIF-2B subunit epsilon
LQKDLVHRGSGAIILAAVLKELYQMDILEEEAMFRWWDESEALGEAEDKEMKRVREKTAPLIQWFKDNDSEESDDSEEASDDSD